MNTSVLAARVRAVNRAHAYAAKLYPQLAEPFRPLVGQKIMKAGGTLMAKYAAMLPKLPYGQGLQVTPHHTDYSLSWTVKTWESVDGGGYYYDIGVYIGNLRNGVLTELCKPFEGRTDYDPLEVHAARERYKEAKRLADEAHSALWPFGEYDR